MKYIKLFIFFLAFVLSFLLYEICFNDKIYYLSLGDNLAVGVTPFDTINKSYSDYFKMYLETKNNLKNYNNHFSEINYKTTDIINDIKLNKEKIINNKTISINESIAKANIITISIGYNDLFYKTKYFKTQFKYEKNMKKYVDELFVNIDYMIELIRKINDCPIYLIGYYNPHIKDDGITDKMIEYTEVKYKSLNKKSVYYVDIKQGFKEKAYYLPSNFNPLPSLEGYNYISNKIIENYEKNK